MSSKFRGPLDSVDEVNFDSSVAESADSKVDESVEGFYNDESGSPEIGKYTNSKISQNTGFPRTGRVGSLARFGASSSHLPNLEAHQHSTLFSLSLIEGRCRTRATHLLNEGRHPADHLSEDHPEVYALARQLFAEMSKELHKAGILPDEFAGQDLEDLRGQYLNAFDAVLHNIAANGTNGIPDRSTSGSIHGSDVFDSGELSSPSAMEQIIKRKNLPGHQQSLLSSLMLRSSVGEPLHTSIFQTQYGTKSLLGKGGFGQVFSVKNLVDDREYAIKRIVIRGKKLNLAGNKEKQQALLMEARSLSKLNHPNIVRYYGAWVETCPAGIVMDGDTSSADISDSGLSQESQELLSNFGKLGFDETQNIRLNGPDHLIYTEEESDVFERSLSDPPTNPQDALVKRSESSYFTGADSNLKGNMIVPRTAVSRNALMAELDAVLFIKMDLYPMTLEDFLWAGQICERRETEIRHCFHTLTAAHILSLILDGVEYIHSQGMIHRDLKPGNILLSVHHNPNLSSAGSVEIGACPECNGGLESRQTFITPHIGDFGLVAETKKPLADNFHNSTFEHKFEPTELARLAPAGSKLYLPQMATGIICPKLDVYSLGIIAFELLYKFGTRTERIMVLEKLKQGEFPADFETHKMASGIKAMTCRNREERWNCTAVRTWLEHIKDRYQRA